VARSKNIESWQLKAKKAFENMIPEITAFFSETAIPVKNRWFVFTRFNRYRFEIMTCKNKREIEKIYILLKSLMQVSKELYCKKGV
jgi:hypothetical protein